MIAQLFFIYYIQAIENCCNCYVRIDDFPKTGYDLS